MVFKKGDDIINRKGRPKGSRNKSSEDIRKVLLEFLNNNIEGLQLMFDLSEPKDQIRLISVILRYVVPLPFNPEALTEDQLLQIINHLKNDQKQKSIISSN